MLYSAFFSPGLRCAVQGSQPSVRASGFPQSWLADYTEESFGEDFILLHAHTLLVPSAGNRMCDGVVYMLTICLRYRQDASEIEPAENNSSTVQMQPFFLPTKWDVFMLVLKKVAKCHSSACHPISSTTDLSFSDVFLN